LRNGGLINFLLTLLRRYFSSGCNLGPFSPADDLPEKDLALIKSHSARNNENEAESKKKTAFIPLYNKNTTQE